MAQVLCPMQVRSIIGQIRPDRQTMLFSATMPNKVEKLVRDALTSPVRVTVGELGAANEDIKQVAQPPIYWKGFRPKCFQNQNSVIAMPGSVLGSSALCP